MLASVAAILINLFGNWVLIFGALGFPAMGVTGAAIATVISRFAECAILIVRAHTQPSRYPFMKGAWRSLRAPAPLWKQVAVKGSPLLLNEFLWSSAIALLAQCYSVRGLTVVAAYNICSTVSNLFNVVFLSMGSAVSIMVGQDLGSGDIEKAQNTAWRLSVLSVASTLVIGLVLALLSTMLPRLYNTTEDVIATAAGFLQASAALMSLHAYANCCYFILRSGGRTIITFFFDCVFTWVFCVPAAYALAHWTQLDIVTVFACVEALNLPKCIIGFILVRRGIWLNNMVQTFEAEGV